MKHVLGNERLFVIQKVLLTAETSLRRKLLRIGEFQQNPKELSEIVDNHICGAVKSSGVRS